MATLTAKQLIEVEKNAKYQAYVRVAAISQATYWHGQNGVSIEEEEDAKNWFQRRQLAEELLDTPEVSVNVARWASKTLPALEFLDVAGITAESTADEIADAITTNQYAGMATAVFEQLASKKLF